MLLGHRLRRRANRDPVGVARVVRAKRSVLDAHDYADVSVEDMRAYVESKGGTFVAPLADDELNDNELAAVSSGTDIAVVVVEGGGVVAASSSVAAA